MNQLIFIENNQALTNSRNIARDFDKEHRHVLESIDKIKGVAENWADLFYETTYIHEQNKQEYREFLMNRDGFTLLAMGFTGKKALEFKMDYLNEFNKMEQFLNSPEMIVQRAMEIQDEKIKRLKLESTKKDQIIGELKPKADYTDIILKNKSLMTITQIAKDYGMSGQAMNNLLRDLKVQFKQSSQWLLYAEYHDKAYTHSETIDFVRKDGSKDVKLITKWTQKGRLFLYNLLKENEVIPVIEKE
ncbi:MAG TPA: phage regulatory protein/antirepressor Ant [Candidatus Avipropionibacterium sp.]|nr:phage regulatory protein/antirepressor Ant [Candidatus Avipropionibacterium sp.]